MAPSAPPSPPKPPKGGWLPPEVPKLGKLCPRGAPQSCPHGAAVAIPDTNTADGKARKEKEKRKNKKKKRKKKKNKSGQQALPTREVVLFVFVEKRTAFGFDLRRAVWRAAAERPRCLGGPRRPPARRFWLSPPKTQLPPPRAPRAGTPGQRGRGGNRRESGAFAPAPPGSGFPSFLGATPSPPGWGRAQGGGPKKPPPGGGGPGFAPAPVLNP